MLSKFLLSTSTVALLETEATDIIAAFFDRSLCNEKTEKISPAVPPKIPSHIVAVLNFLALEQKDK